MMHYLMRDATALDWLVAFAILMLLLLRLLT